MKSFENILACDTALGGMSVGVVTREAKVTRRIETAREQAALLVPLIRETLEEANLSFADLDLIVSSTGPGSFTGLRIGLSTARSLALALDKPARGVSTLAVVARQTQTRDKRAVLLETKRRDFYVQVFDEKARPLGKPQALEGEALLSSLQENGPCHLAGDALARFTREAGAEWVRAHACGQSPMVLLDPLVMARMGKEAAALPPEPLEPLYLRGADVSRPKVPPRTLEGSFK